MTKHEEITTLDLIKKWRSIRAHTGEPSIPSTLRVLRLVSGGHPAESKPLHTKHSESKAHYDGYRAGSAKISPTSSQEVNALLTPRNIAVTQMEL